MSCQVPGAHCVLLGEGEGRREGGFPQHLLLHVARVLIRFQGPVEERKQSHSEGEVGGHCILLSFFLCKCKQCKRNITM